MTGRSGDSQMTGSVIARAVAARGLSRMSGVMWPMIAQQANPVGADIIGLIARAIGLTGYRASNASLYKDLRWMSRCFL